VSGPVGVVAHAARWCGGPDLAGAGPCQHRASPQSLDEGGDHRTHAVRRIASPTTANGIRPADDTWPMGGPRRARDVTWCPQVFRGVRLDGSATSRFDTGCELFIHSRGASTNRRFRVALHDPTRQTAAASMHRLGDLCAHTARSPSRDRKSSHLAPGGALSRRARTSQPHVRLDTTPQRVVRPCSVR
jgi:hypothetical protein